MSSTRLASIVAITVIIAIAPGCQHTPPSRTITEADFRAMQPFQGQVTAIERLEWPPQQPVQSVTGPDYRVTIRRMDDGSTIVIERIETTLLSDESLVANLASAQGTYPADLFKSKFAAPATAPGAE